MMVYFHNIILPPKEHLKYPKKRDQKNKLDFSIVTTSLTYLCQTIAYIHYLSSI